jgi:peptidyl-prolyl cis-trans isomerase D
VISQEAERLGLGASDAELADKIRKRYSDASGNFVGLDRYKELVVAQYGDIESFENEIRDEIAQEKLQAFVTPASMFLTEVEEEYKRRNTSFDVSYIAVSADKLAEKIQPSDDELRSYYESHKTDYRYLEPQKRFATSLSTLKKSVPRSRFLSGSKNSVRQPGPSSSKKRASRSSRFF